MSPPMPRAELASLRAVPRGHPTSWPGAPRPRARSPGGGVRAGADPNTSGASLGDRARDVPAADRGPARRVRGTADRPGSQSVQVTGLPR